METEFKKDNIGPELEHPARKLIVGDLKDVLTYRRLPEDYRRPCVYQERELSGPMTIKGVRGLVL